MTMYAVGAQVFPPGAIEKAIDYTQLPWKLRRYSDFVEYHTELTKKFPYFLIPHLPPKQNTLSESDLRSRLSHLLQWLQFILLHPIIQQSPLTKAFINDATINWSRAAQLGGNGLSSTEFLYEGSEDGTIHGHTDKDESRLPEAVEGTVVVSQVFMKYTEAARYKCIREMHTIARYYK